MELRDIWSGAHKIADTIYVNQDLYSVSTLDICGFDRDSLRT